MFTIENYDRWKQQTPEDVFRSEEEFEQYENDKMDEADRRYDQLKDEGKV